MIDEHTRLQACLKDLSEQKPIGRHVGAKNKPQPAKDGPLWRAFTEWFACAQVRADRRADLWRAFNAGAEATDKLSEEGR